MGFVDIIYVTVTRPAKMCNMIRAKIEVGTLWPENNNFIVFKGY